jgi:lipid-A-disaccharide synthase
VPELIQGDCTPERLGGAVDALLTEEPRRRAQIAACREALKQLGLGEESPSRRAADLVLSLIAAQQRRAAPNAA